MIYCSRQMMYEFILRIDVQQYFMFVKPHIYWVIDIRSRRVRDGSFVKSGNGMREVGRQRG